MNAIKFFLTISNYDEKTCMSDIIDITKYNELKTNNGGHWCRIDSNFGKNYKFYTVNERGTKRCSWIPSKEEEKIIVHNINKIKNKLSGKGNKLRFIQIIGVQDKIINRPIRKNIRDIIIKKRCVSCGTNNDIEVDHKNGLYNDKRVLNVKTQTIDDFQPLCRHCNLEKRQIIKKMKETGKRPKATQHPMFKPFGIDFIYGDETFDINDPNALLGTLWYDFINFTTELIQLHHKI